MLRVSYKKVYGYFYMKNLDGKLFKCSIHPANCEFAVVYHTNRRHHHDLVFWASSLQHLKNCFDKKDPVFTEKNLIQVTFFTNMPHFEKYAKIIALGGFKVKIVNKE